MDEFKMWFSIIMPILAIIVIPLALYSFKASLRISEQTMEKNFKSWMNTMEGNLKTFIKESYSDKVNQAETTKDIERLDADIERIREEIDLKGEMASMKKIVKSLAR